MGTNGEFELKDPNGEFLLDDNGNWQICGNCCDSGGGNPCAAAAHGSDCGQCPTGQTPNGFAMEYNGITTATCCAACDQGAVHPGDLDSIDFHVNLINTWDGSQQNLTQGAGNCYFGVTPAGAQQNAWTQYRDATCGTVWGTSQAKPIFTIDLEGGNIIARIYSTDGNTCSGTARKWLYFEGQRSIPTNCVITSSIVINNSLASGDCGTTGSFTDTRPVTVDYIVAGYGGTVEICEGTF
jgi:hypothetical protein